MAKRSYELREHPTMEVEIGGRPYRARLGDMTFSLLARGGVQFSQRKTFARPDGDGAFGGGVSARRTFFFRDADIGKRRRRRGTNRH